MITALLKKLEPFAKASAVPEPRGVEARSAPRHETEIEATLSWLGKDYPCTIRNVSTKGMTVAVGGVELCAGVQVQVRCASGLALCGIVRWLRDGTVGVQFIQPLALDQVQSMRIQVPEGMKPRAARARTLLPATARFANQSRNVEVLNVSVGGLQMKSSLPPQLGQPVMIEFPDMLPISGHVRWSRAGCAGVMFTKLLPMGVAEELAGRGFLPPSWLQEVRSVHDMAHAC